MPLRFSFNHQPYLLFHAEALTDSEGFMEDARAIGCWAPGNQTLHPSAVAVFQNRTTVGAEVHFGTAHDVRLTRGMLMGFFRYGFEVLLIPKLVAHIAAWNVPAQLAALKSGFFINGYVGAGGDGTEDAIVMTLTKSSCVWLPPARPQTIAIEAIRETEGA